MLRRRIYLTLVLFGASGLVGCGAYQRPATSEGEAAKFDFGALAGDLMTAIGTVKEVATEVSAAKASGEDPDLFSLGELIIGGLFGTTLLGAAANKLRKMKPPAEGT